MLGRGSSREGRTEEVGVESGEVTLAMEGELIRGGGAGELARGEVIVAIFAEGASLVSRKGGPRLSRPWTVWRRGRCTQKIEHGVDCMRF